MTPESLEVRFGRLAEHLQGFESYAREVLQDLTAESQIHERTLREIVRQETRELVSSITACRASVEAVRREIAREKEERQIALLAEQKRRGDQLEEAERTRAEGRRRTVRWLIPVIISLSGVIVAIAALLVSKGGL